MEKSTGELNGQSGRPLKKAVYAAIFSTLLGPGAGQFYNRQWLKGSLFAFMFMTGLLGLCVFLGAKAKVAIEILAGASPERLSDPDFAYQLAQRIMQENALALKSMTWGIAILWIASVADAFLSARKTIASAPPPVNPFKDLDTPV